jgi:ABC-type Zn2+ transport system substrate-binding protein/surface adhesin
LEHLQDLKTDGVTEVAESELQSLVLQRRLLANVIEEKREMKVKRSPDECTDEKHEHDLQEHEHKCEHKREHKREQEQNSERALVENSLRLSRVQPQL